MKQLKNVKLKLTLSLLLSLLLPVCHATAQQVIYETGFETSDIFSHSPKYNNKEMERLGPTYQKWGVVFGSVSETDPLSGKMSLHLRVNKTSSTVPYARTLFLLNYVCYMTFNAVYDHNSGDSLLVQYSTDGGTKWIGDSIYFLPRKKADEPFTYKVGTDVCNVMFRFTPLDYKKSTDTHIIIDDITVYGNPKITVGKDNYATFYSEKAYIMPTGLKGGVITNADKETNVLTNDYRYPEGTVVPERVSLLLKGNEGTYPYTITKNSGDMPKGNLLHSGESVDTLGYTYVKGTNVRYYVLSHSLTDGRLGFFWAADNGGQIKYQYPHVFLAVDFGASSKAPSKLTISGDENLTGITSTTVRATRNSKIYSITGAEISGRTDINSLPAGIYIKDGKKIIIK